MRENQINQSIKSYWQTTHLEHQENVQIPFPSRQQLLPFVYRIPTACLETIDSRVTQHSNSFSLISCTTYSSGTRIYSVTQIHVCSLNLNYFINSQLLILLLLQLFPSICKQGGECVHAGGLTDEALTQSRSLCQAFAP